MKKLCIVFKEGHDKNSSSVKKTKETVIQYGWRLLHEVSQFNPSFPLIIHFAPLQSANIEAVAGSLYHNPCVKQLSFPPLLNCDGVTS